MISGQILTVLGWVLAPVCASLITYIVTKGKAKSAHEKAVDEGLCALLRKALIDIHREYVALGKPCPVRIKEQATAIHSAYTALGGNGTGTQLWHEIMEAHVE